METLKTIFAIIGLLCTLSAVLLFGYILVNTKGKGQPTRFKNR